LQRKFIDSGECDSRNGHVDALNLHGIGNIDGSDQERIVTIDFVRRSGNWNFFSILQHTLDVQRQGLLGHREHFVDGGSGRHAARQIRERRAVVAVSLLVDQSDVGIRSHRLTL
jgi:hypothetical protein